MFPNYSELNIFHPTGHGSQIFIRYYKFWDIRVYIYTSPTLYSVRFRFGFPTINVYLNVMQTTRRWFTV